ncbi:MAG: tetratricopeptide repeat protein [Balneolaceae bacterium]
MLPKTNTMYRKILSSVFTLAIFIGLFVGCQSTNPFVSDVESDLLMEEYESALENAERAVEEYPDDPLSYYYKGVALGQYAGTLDDPEERREYYEEMNEAYDQAREMFAEMEDPPRAAQGLDEDIENQRVTLWGTEHNQAIEYATDDSLQQATENPNQFAIGHLRNATIIEPDSALSWSVLSQIYAMEDQLEESAETLQRALEVSDEPEYEDYLRMGDLYLILERPEDAVSSLQEAQEAFPDSVEITQKLADAYQGAGQTDRAIEVVEGLIEDDPENPQYYRALGTQYYQTALEVGENLEDDYSEIFEMEQELEQAEGSEAEEIEQRIQELEEETSEVQERYDELSEQAIDALSRAVELDPEDDSSYNTLGIIYQNRSAALFEERNRTPDNEEAEQIDQEARDELREAMNYYEQAAELDPENTDYWQSLFRVYTTLGMDEEAEEAEEKAGM